jgi:hypothetical protein
MGSPAVARLAKELKVFESHIQSISLMVKIERAFGFVTLFAAQKSQLFSFQVQ